MGYIRNHLSVIRNGVLIFLIGSSIFYIGILVGNGRIRFHHLASTNSGLPSTLDYSSVDQIYGLIKNDYDGKLTTSQILDGLKSGLAQSTGDPYTEYFNPDAAKKFSQQLSESFTGIGAEIGQDSHNNIIIVAPIDGFPAAKAGLRSKDIIATIDGTTTTNMTIDTAVSHIRGPKGSTVNLGIIRNNQQLKISVVRDNITVPSVTTKTLDGNIGYIKINQFKDDTTDLSFKAAQQFQQSNVKGIILDLRDNPGGTLDAAVNVSSFWLAQGKTVLLEKRGGKLDKSYNSTGNNILNNIPTVILINSGSASASEIVAGALHDNGAAHLIGEKSYGKGSVQEINNLPDGSILKITIARWYRPNGENIDKKGITPDQVVQMSDNDFKNGLDPQRDAAQSWLKAH